MYHGRPYEDPAIPVYTISPIMSEPTPSVTYTISRAGLTINPAYLTMLVTDFCGRMVMCDDTEFSVEFQLISHYKAFDSALGSHRRGKPRRKGPSKDSP